MPTLNPVYHLLKIITKLWNDQNVHPSTVGLTHHYLSIVRT